jgi:hypothetical protein
MGFTYVPRAAAKPPCANNIKPELVTLHRILGKTLAPRVGDASACSIYERNLIKYLIRDGNFTHRC